MGIERKIVTVNITPDGTLIYDGSVGQKSYIISCFFGGNPFIIFVISNSGNINYFLNGSLPIGYSLYIEGPNERFLKIKSDGDSINILFTFTKIA